MKKQKTTFHIISIFPEVVKNYCETSILKKAKEKDLLDFKFYNLRDFSKERNKKLDDKPYAGGPGMLLYALPILECVENIKKSISISRWKKTKIILFKPLGEKFTNNKAFEYSQNFTDIILLCGRYEGIDSRVEEILKPEIISIGDFVLTGGEIPAMAVIDATARQIKGVLGDEFSLEEKRNYRDEFYTRPEVLIWKKKKYIVPEVLLSGDHKKIESWKKK